jgi:hypothetical protein
MLVWLAFSGLLRLSFFGVILSKSVAHDGNGNVSFVAAGAMLPQKNTLPNSEVAPAFLHG